MGALLSQLEGIVKIHKNFPKREMPDDRREDRF